MSADPRQTSAPELKAQIEVERTGRPFLVFRDGEGEQRIVAVETGTTALWIGRGGSADLRLDWDEEISALHAQIEVVRDECTLLDDGLSRNGSFVNEERVDGRRRLRDGDTLRFGRTAVLFRRPGEDAPEATVAAGQVPAAATISPGQRRVLLALCRPFKDESPFATPATNQAIAEELHLSVDAVKTHMRALFEKLEVGDLPQNQKRVALAERALQSGI
ncbi:MAG TPA: FHA domain-containing protein, partial [Solirubrobacterales bacterium]|nr:FHA domain-containing protein [Solirubrobacterales bacterium]